MRHRHIGRLVWIGVASAALSVSCRSPSELESSGFLGDELPPLRRDSASDSLVYRAPDAELARYDRVLLDPVQIWIDPETRHRSVSWGDIRRLARTFEQSIRDALAGGYPVVEEPGPTTLRIRLALTGVQGKGEGYSTRANLGYGDPDTVDEVSAHGTKLGIQTVSAEAEFLDSLTGERLFAAVARRSATGRGGRTPWEATSRIFTDWAGRVREFLDGARRSE